MAIYYSDIAKEAARILHECNGEEVRYRVSMSKAYYALYHAALSYADSVSLPPVSDTSGPTHKKLRAFYCDDLAVDKAVRMKHRKIGWSLKALHEIRCNADYGLDLDIPYSDAEVQLMRVVETISVVEGLQRTKAA